MTHGPLVETGIKNLDLLLYGGLPGGSVTVIGGTPGAGKTTLTHQICFHNATPGRPALIFQTLSEPTAKTLVYLKQFTFFDPKKIEDGSVRFFDLGSISRSEGLEKSLALIIEQFKKSSPAIVVIDSFKVFEDLARSKEEFRKFSYEVAVHLMAWECTAFLIGEYAEADLQTNALFSVVDGIITLTSENIDGDDERSLKVIKMRGSNHYRDRHLVMITNDGIQLYAPRATIRRESHADSRTGEVLRSSTGIRGVDALLGPGIPAGSSLLISGAAGTGKTIFLVESLYRGATEFGEKGILFTFEETPERIIAAGEGLGFDLKREIDRGRIEIVFIPQTDIIVEKHLQMMSDKIDEFQAKRIAIDSMSVFLHKIESARSAREKVFQLTTLVQRVRGIGFFATDIVFGTSRVSRFGVEETVADGVILLTSVTKGLHRQRYVEVYKLRNTAHREGRFRMAVQKGGLSVENHNGDEKTLKKTSPKRGGPKGRRR